MSIKIRRFNKLNEAFGVREYNIEKIQDKIISTVNKSYKEFCSEHSDYPSETDKLSDEQTNAFIAWFTEHKTEPLSDEIEDVVCDLGKFKIKDFSIQMYMCDWIGCAGAFVEDISEIEKRLGVVFIDTPSTIKHVLAGKVAFNSTLTHEIRHAENYLNSWTHGAFENKKMLFDVNGEKYNYNVEFASFSYSDDDIRLLTYFLCREEMTAFNNTIYEFYKRMFNPKDLKVFYRVIKKYTEETGDVLKFRNMSDLLLQKTEGHYSSSNKMFDVFSVGYSMFKIYFVDVNELMASYDFFKKYIVDAISGRDKKGAEFAYWLFCHMNSQLVSEKKQAKLRKSLLDYVKKHVSDGLSVEESIVYFIENVYSRKLYDKLRIEFSDYKKKIVSMMLKFISKFENVDGSEEKLREVIEKYHQEFKK